VPDVTYLIVAHDAARTVEASVRAALRQSGVDVEVVVVDDASTDATADIVRSIDDERVRVVRLERNVGPGGARNVGFDVATGEWVAVLDSDDEIVPDRTAMMLERARATGADIVVDNLLHVDEVTGRRRPMFTTQTFKYPSRLDLPDFINANIMLERAFPFAYGYLKPIFRRALIESPRLRYREQLRIGEDFYFLADLLSRAGFAATEPAPGYRYLARQDSTSHRLSLDNVLLMQVNDDRFRREHELDARADDALHRRSRSLEETIAFLQLAASVRERSFDKAAWIVATHPRVLRHLRLPVQAKLSRLARRRHP